MPKAIGLHNTHFYQVPGKAWTYRDEKDLFEDYVRLVQTDLKLDNGIHFAAWRGPLRSGGILRHEGQLKVTGLCGTEEITIRDLLWSKIKVVFGTKRACEYHIEVFHDTIHRGSNMWWANIYFYTKALAATFVERMNGSSGGFGKVIDLTGPANPVCKFCLREIQIDDDCPHYGLRLQHEEPVNDLTRLLMQTHLNVPKTAIVVGHGNAPNRDFSYVWFDSEENRINAKKGILNLKQMGIITTIPLTCSSVQRECYLCGFLTPEGHPHTGYNCPKANKIAQDKKPRQIRTIIPAKGEDTKSKHYSKSLPRWTKAEYKVKPKPDPRYSSSHPWPNQAYQRGSLLLTAATSHVEPLIPR